MVSVISAESGATKDLSRGMSLEDAQNATPAGNVGCLAERWGGMTKKTPKVTSKVTPAKMREETVMVGDEKVKVIDIGGGVPEMNLDRMDSFEDAGDEDDDAARCTCMMPDLDMRWLDFFWGKPEEPQ